MDRRIGLFLHSLDGGGAERVMVTLANGFAQRGYSVDLVLARVEGPYLKDVSPAVRIVDLKTKNFTRVLFPLVRYLRRERPAAMLSALDHANVMAILARELSKVPTRLVVSVHNTISVEAARCRNHTFYALVPRLYPMADRVVAVSRGAARDLERFAELPEGSVQAIYNPFDLEGIGKLAAEAAPHPWLHPGETRPVIVAIGRLTEQKDFPTLIRAFSAVRARHDARLLILGEGKLRGDLAALAASLGLTSDDFDMPGFVTNPFAYLARAALFVLSSRWEGLPSVLIEAMACGTPVVSTDCPSGPREILDNGRWGQLVPVGNANALAQAIMAVLEAPREHLPDVRERARDFGQEHAIDAYLVAFGLPPPR